MQNITPDFPDTPENRAEFGKAATPRAYQPRPEAPRLHPIDPATAQAHFRRIARFGK